MCIKSTYIMILMQQHYMDIPRYVFVYMLYKQVYLYYDIDATTLHGYTKICLCVYVI